jgi:hypothetical protein
MLTDIFATRYADRPIWTAVGERERILITQGWRIVLEQVMPYWRDGKVFEFNKPRWVSVHNKLSMELGKESLAPLTWNYYDANKVWQYGTYSMDMVCKTWMLAPFKGDIDPDRYMKERISFIELAFRDRMEAIAAINKGLPEVLQNAVFADILHGNSQLNALFGSYGDELNERFRQAKAPLNYHNGFIQIETDQKTQEQIAAPFWKLVSDPKWKNVDTDMKEAVDRREANDRDPAFYASKALESTIKIISDEKGWSSGKENGAAAYIDNLVASKNGRFIEVWEGEALKAIFRHVRNPLGHGPGGEPMPELTQQQTNWTIETAMSWTKSLIQRL